jgi:catechol 2,3-dioxygenase-like lactoylglutathione lyase family enzyme
MPETPRLEAVHPVFMVRDVRAAVEFYSLLGFGLTFQDDPRSPKYAGIRRDDVEFHLQWHDESAWAHAGDRPACRFYVSDVDAFYAELKDHGALAGQIPGSSPWLAPADTPWGTREFHLRDLDGNGLQFYRSR